MAKNPEHGRSINMPQEYFRVGKTRVTHVKRRTLERTFRALEHGVPLSNTQLRFIEQNESLVNDYKKDRENEARRRSGRL